MKHLTKLLRYSYDLQEKEPEKSAYWHLQQLRIEIKQLALHDVSGMFSSEKIEQAYKDGVRDALAKGYGTFDEENYR
jgi:hypothetical protein